MGHVVLVVFRRRAGLFRQELIHLAGRNADSLQHIALTQQSQRQLLTHFLAVGGVIDSLLLERFGKLGQRDVVALCDLGQGAVQRFVRHFQAGTVGALSLDLLQDEPLEDLLAQNVRRRQLELLGTQPLADRGHLVVELAVQHHAVVHDGGDAVEHHALGGKLARLSVHESALKEEELPRSPATSAAAMRSRQKPRFWRRARPRAPPAFLPAK